MAIIFSPQKVFIEHLLCGRHCSDNPCQKEFALWRGTPAECPQCFAVPGSGVFALGKDCVPCLVRGRAGAGMESEVLMMLAL